MDKLDGVIREEEYSRLSKKFRSDLTDVKFKVEQLEGKNETSIDSSKRLLKLHLGRRGSGPKIQKTL
ncbi:MAG: hypothetical protein PHR66_07845 [Desulfuromonadaceae bacterium]|nr:hypothetical protein [Desulfuromonadaceae bacterium]